MSTLMYIEDLRREGDTGRGRHILSKGAEHAAGRPRYLRIPKYK